MRCYVNTKSLTIGMLLVVIFLASILASGFLGSADLSASTALSVIKSKLSGTDIESVPKSALYIVWELRMPRVLLAIVIGGGLAIAGVSMQALTQNVLAEPYMLGVSSGALVGVTLTNYFANSILFKTMTTPIAAFLGACIALLLVYRVGATGGDTSNNRLILAGMAVSIILNALSNFLIITMPDINAIRNVLSWTMGSLAGARWNNLLIPSSGILLSSIYFFINARNYDVISLGGETALSLGVDVRKLKRTSIIVVSFIAAFSVSAAGLIGLVGFIIPHIIRMLFGSEHRKLFPLSFLAGALFLIWMDILARTVIAPRELPIGIFTAICGGPAFVWVLMRKKR